MITLHQINGKDLSKNSGVNEIKDGQSDGRYRNDNNRDRNSFKVEQTSFKGG